jgi:ABC-2 type transport system ATP-binding protein
VAEVVLAESLTKKFGSNSWFKRFTHSFRRFAFWTARSRRTASFDGVVDAVADLSFALESGTVTGFLGPNGAGKTTTLRMLLGLSVPTSGRALVFGTTYAALEGPPHRIGAVLEATDFHPGRSGRNHLRMLSIAAGISNERVEEVLRLVELDGAADRRVKGYSLGMRQRLGLASALLGDPDLLILDEPANGLDPEGVRWLRDFLRAYAEGGRTVLVSSHVLAEVAQTVDHVLIVARGRLVAESSLAELENRARRSVRVRSPQASELEQALIASGMSVERDEDGALLVDGREIERVGEVAAKAGVVLHELALTGVSLEEIFLELTATGDAT